MNNVNDKVRIFVVDHRECPDESFLPIIGVGKNRVSDYRDDVGDNIAEWNPWINEATAIYWIWKHFDEIAPKAELVGICHYRRYWTKDWWMWIENRPRVKRLLPFWNKISKHFNSPKLIGLRPGQIFQRKLLRQCDGFIGQLAYPFGPDGIVSDEGTVEKAFRDGFLASLPKIFDDCLNRFTAHFPDLSERISAYIKGNRMYHLNMFLVSREEYFKYCEFMFSLIMPYAKEIRNSPIGELPYKRRGVGYLMECMTGLYWHCRILQGLELEELNIWRFDAENYTPAK